MSTIAESLTKEDCLDIIARLIAAMQLGICIRDQDGHRWLEAATDDDYPPDESRFNYLLRTNGVSVNDKIYGSYLEALQVVDDALEMAKQPSLLECYRQRFDTSEDLEIFSLPNPHHSRVDKAQGEGGLS